MDLLSHNHTNPINSMSFKIENKPLQSSKTSPVTDALRDAVALLKPGQSFAVTKKGQLALAVRLAKEQGILVNTSTANGEWRVGIKD